MAVRTEELLEVMDLTGDGERTLLVDYSTGMRKKIGLATALLHGPRLLVLDEPFEAVDPVSAAALKGILTPFVLAGGSAGWRARALGRPSREWSPRPCWC